MCLAESEGYHGNWHSTHAWMRVRSTKFIGTVLITTEFFNVLYARYNVDPPNFQNKYDCCMQTSLVHHALNCTNVDLVIARHNEIRDNIIHLTIQAFSHHCVIGEPLIHLVC